MHHRAHHQPRAVGERGEREQGAEEARQAQRQRGERDDAVERESPELQGTVAGIARGALLDVVVHRRRPEADPRVHALHVARALGHRAERVDDGARHESEVTGPARHRDDRDAGEQPVEQVRGEAARRGIGRAVAAQRDHHVVAIVPLRDEIAHEFRRVLQVGVDRDDGIAACVVEAGGQRDLLAEVARQRDDANPRIARGEGGKHRERRITAAVVDEHRLDVDAERGKRVGGARPERREARSLVVAGNHQREDGMLAHGRDCRTGGDDRRAEARPTTAPSGRARRPIGSGVRPALLWVGRQPDAFVGRADARRCSGARESPPRGRRAGSARRA